MADKAPKAKSVLGTLPSARPERLGTPRGGAAKPKAKAKPRAVTPGCSTLAQRTTPEAPPPRPIAPPKGTELVTTAIRATGELAQIGFTLSGRALKRALRR